LLRLSIKMTSLWIAGLLVMAMLRVHCRVLTTTVAYNLGKLKSQESALLEQRSALQAEYAKITAKKSLESLALSGQYLEGQREAKQ
jgi:cell division protein FtsL